MNENEEVAPEHPSQREFRLRQDRLAAQNARREEKLGAAPTPAEKYEKVSADAPPPAEVVSETVTPPAPAPAEPTPAPSRKSDKKGGDPISE